MSAVIFTMIGVGVAVGVSEKVLNALGKADYAQTVNVAGIALEGSLAVGLVISLIKTLKTI